MCTIEIKNVAMATQFTEGIRRAVPNTMFSISQYKWVIIIAYSNCPFHLPKGRPKSIYTFSNVPFKYKSNLLL